MSARAKSQESSSEHRSEADVAAHAWQALRTLVLERHDRRAAACAALGMSFIRAKALRRLAVGPLTLRELAGALMTDAPYTTVIVDDLEERGLVLRSPHRDDRRAKLVTVTADGRKLADLADRILGEPPAALRALSPADLANLDRIAIILLDDS
jgi:DNA-binding MarR family transcriptional regulator